MGMVYGMLWKGWPPRLCTPYHSTYGPSVTGTANVPDIDHVAPGATDPGRGMDVLHVVCRA